jgi:hypothetical protein
MKRELAAAVDARDPFRVRDLVLAATEKERRAAGRELEARGPLHRGGSRRAEAAALARLGTATARQIRTDAWVLTSFEKSRDYPVLAAEVIRARGDAFANAVAAAFMQDEFWVDWPIVRELVRTGAIAKPDDERYTLTMVRGLGLRTGDGGLDVVLRELLADADLLEDELWRIFEVDVGGALAVANVWSPKDPKDPRAGYTTSGNRWSHALVELMASGVVDRERVLDATLDALARDFRPSNLKWYADLHDALEARVEELVARVERYLALVAAPAPAAMKLGLAALRALGPEVPVDGLVRCAPAALTQKQKNLAVLALGLLGDAAEREPGARAAVLAAAAEALGHARPDVQERALDLLERFADDLPRADLLGYVDVVAPSVRGRLTRLTGIELSAPEPEVVSRVPVAGAGGPRPLEAVGSVDELIDLAASLLEGRGSGDDAERFLDGVSRLCDRRPRGFEARTAGLLKRAQDPDAWMLGGTGRGFVAVVVQAWVDRRRVGSEVLPNTLLGFLGVRALEVAHRASRGVARELLSFPTHEGGLLDPEVLAARERGGGRVLNRPGSFDRAQARLRALSPGAPIAFSPIAAEQNQFGLPARTVKLAPQAVPPELDVLRNVLSTDPDDKDVPVWWGVRSSWASWDALGGRWSLTVVPSCPEIAFAGAAMAAADALEHAPQLHPEPALEHALDPRVPLGPEAWLLVALALVSKSADLRRAATDVVVAAVGDGRFDPDALGAALAWLADSGFAKVSRLEQPLRDSGHVSARHAESMLRLVEALVAGCDRTPHGLQAPLGAVLEHAVATRLVVVRREPLERVAAGVTPSSKLGKLTRALLELRAA